MSTAVAPRVPPASGRGIPIPNGVQRGLPAFEAPAAWRLTTLAGRFSEISGSHAGAPLTLAFRIVLEAQRLGEPVAWVGDRRSVFYPPDVADCGIDLDSLVVVRVDGAIPGARVVDHLLRSGAFGLVVQDVGAGTGLPLPVQTRLAGLAKKHEAAWLCITEKEDRKASIGSLVSLRADAVRVEQAVNGFRCEIRILKDKRRGPGWTHGEVCHGPDGLC